MTVRRLNPEMPERMQSAEMAEVDPLYRRLMPDLSLVAEKAFREHPGVRRFRLRGPSSIVILKPGESAPDGTDTGADGVSRPAAGVRVAGTAQTALVDPLLPQFGGSPERAAAAIGAFLAGQVAEKADSLGPVAKLRTEVQIFGELPIVAPSPAGPAVRRPGDPPLLRGRITVMFG